MTIAEELRAAALGKSPREWTRLGSWIEYPAFHTAAAYIGHKPVPARYLSGLTKDECRIFLLFVAEAIES